MVQTNDNRVKGNMGFEIPNSLFSSISFSIPQLMLWKITVLKQMNSIFFY